MGPMMQTLMESFRLSDFLMNLVLDDLPNADAVRRSRGGDGASVSWITGHLLAYRHWAMQLLGVEGENPYAAFQATGAGDGRAYPTIEELLAAWNESAEALAAAAAGATDEALLAPVGDGGPHGEKRVLDQMAFIAWHEASHIGGIGLIRLEMGYRATADLAMEAVARAGGATEPPPA